MRQLQVVLLLIVFTLLGYASSIRTIDNKQNRIEEKSSKISSTEKILRTLYISYFDRAPDVGGLSYWRDVYDNYLQEGLDSKGAFVKIAQEFFKNQEAGTLNAQSNQEFIETIYQNQLGEVGDKEGIKFWKESLDKGLSRSEFMVNFITSALSIKPEEITANNFPSFSEIELNTAQKRVQFLEDKLTLSVSFTEIFEELTNPTDTNNLSQDPSYLASQLLMSEFKDKRNVESLEILMNRIKDDFSSQENPNGKDVMGALVAPLSLERNYRQSKALWDSKDTKDYTYVYDKSCFCLEEEKVQIIVDDKEVVEATYIPSNVKLTTTQRNYIGTVEDYFTIIANAIENKVAKLEVTYNTRYGYPTSIYIDRDKMIADEEITHHLTQLKLSSDNVDSSIIQPIKIPFREHGYSQYHTKIIASQEDLNRFANQVKSDPNWNNKKEFLALFNEVEFDFDSKNILFYRITEPSGSNTLYVHKPILSPSKDEILIDIDRDVPNIGTSDMAYYALSYHINKNIKSIVFNDAKQEVIIENRSSDMVVPKNCQAWFDGCNSCSRSENNQAICTQLYCFVYRAQDFRCTQWK